MLDVVEYLYEHFIFSEWFRGRRVTVIVGAVVNDAIHIQVKVVELGDAILCYQLRDRRIALREPSEEFGDTCVVLVCQSTA